MLPGTEIRQQLEQKGLVLRKRFDAIAFIKPVGVPGNSLPDYRQHHLENLDGEGGIDSDCPMIEWGSRKGRIFLSHWAYVPGPGPGDFEEYFDSEEEAGEFILSYFFGDNPYFLDKVEDQRHRRNSYNLEELAAITSEVLRLTKELFGEKEFSWDRGAYYRLPVEKFWLDGPEPEFPELVGEIGFMGYTMMMLRRKVNSGRSLTSKDVSTVADMFRHLSLEMKQLESNSP